MTNNTKIARILVDEGVMVQVDPVSRATRLFFCKDCNVGFLKESNLEKHIFIKDHPTLSCFNCQKQSIYLISCYKCGVKCCKPCGKKSKNCYSCKDSRKRKFNGPTLIDELEVIEAA